jgi:hypothetical protein
MNEDRLDAISRSLGRIEGKLEALDALKLEKRVSALERWQSRILGMAAGVAAVVTAGFNALISGSAKF